MPKLLALDPSSTAIGYAVLDIPSRKPVDVGVIKPKGKLSVCQRVQAMCIDVAALVAEVRPRTIICEAMDSRQYTRDAGRTTALPVCGWAMGAVFGYCWSRYGPDGVLVLPVGNQEWTRGYPKETRKLTAAARWPSELWAKDRGGDAADALEMGVWWLLTGMRVAKEATE